MNDKIGVGNKQHKELTWEFSGIIFGYISSVDSAIRLVFYHICDMKVENIPHSFRLLTAIAYLFLVVVIASWTMVRYRILNHSKNRDALPTIADALKELKRRKLIRFFRTFGFSDLHDLVLKKYGVVFYDRFRRPNDWEQKNDLLDYIERYTLASESIEFQYPKDYKFLEYRTSCGNENREYQPTQKLTWRNTPYRFLTLFSITGLRWTIRHLIRNS